MKIYGIKFAIFKIKLKSFAIILDMNFRWLLVLLVLQTLLFSVVAPKISEPLKYTLFFGFCLIFLVGLWRTFQTRNGGHY